MNAEIPDLVAGQVMAAFVVPQVVVAPIKAGKLRALAVRADKRLPGLPDVPTSAEAGLPGVEALVWNGIFAPAGTPRPVIDILHRELVKAYNAPEIKAQVEATGSYVAADTPENSPPSSAPRSPSGAGSGAQPASSRSSELGVDAKVRNGRAESSAAFKRRRRSRRFSTRAEAPHVDELDGDACPFRSRRAG